MGKVTLKEICNSVREIIFDRFVVPTFAIKQSEQLESVKVIPGANGSLSFGGTTPKSYNFLNYSNIGELLEALIADGIVLAYTAYFKASDSPISLIGQTSNLTDDNAKILKQYFFSDSDIIELIVTYYYKVLSLIVDEVDDELLGKLKRPSERHLVLWVSYYLVEKRRLYEIAQKTITQSFTDGTDFINSGESGNPQNVTVSIGSVFSITENTKDGYFYEDFNRIGSENIFGDRYSFWYRLQVYIRQLLEEEFNDYSLRKDNVMMGKMQLNRDLDFRAYYDSYPFTLSPLTRGIISRVNK